MVANHKYGKIEGEIYKDTELCLDIDQDFKKTNIFHVPNQTENTKNIEVNFFRYMQRYGSNYTCDLMDRACPRFFALSPETTLMDIKRLILEKLRGVFE